MIVILTAGAVQLSNGQDVAPKKIVDIPDSLFQVQDEDGFFWQLMGNGALTSGETQYLQSGMNLLVDNVAFAPAEALVRAPGEGVSKIDAVFTETRKELLISRDVWIDTKRSGVRFFDSIKNTGAKPVDVVVVLRTTYPFGWQSLHDSEGNLLSSDPVLRLDPDDSGLAVHFSPSEGRHDTLFLTGTDAEGVEPELGASTNSRELTFQYTLSLKAGETASVYHWLMQRNLPSPAAAANVLTQFLQRNQLINPGVSSLQAVSVVNFPRSAFPDEAAAPSRLRELLALNELMDQIGWHRRRSDAHWLGQTNQISGELSRKGSLTITGNEFGERVVPLDRIAAIRGDAESELKPFLYLRNGEVLTGDLADGGDRGTVHCDVAHERCGARPVDDQTVADHQIVRVLTHVRSPIVLGSTARPGADGARHATNRNRCFERLSERPASLGPCAHDGPAPGISRSLPTVATTT